ncbi:MAG: hypothetical protein ABI091_30190 [Ferruginibacter sp.]
MDKEMNRMMDKLDNAIAAFEDENSELPFSERFSMLRWAWLDNAFDTMKVIKKKGIKNPVSEDATYIQEQGIKQFSLMEKMYNMELKAGEKKGKKQEDIDTDWLKEIKKSKSSIGDIVRVTQKAND